MCRVFCLHALKMQTAVNCHVGARNGIRVLYSGKAATDALNH